MGKNSFKNDEDYRRRRERNNEAVKKSRVKSKMRSQATQERVSQLQMENTQLEERMKYLASEVDFYKDMLCNSGGVETTDNAKVQHVLDELSKSDAYASAASSGPSNSRRSSRRSTDHKY